MEFRLNEPEPGVFEIVQSMPVVVGTFADRGIAQKVMGFLEMDAVNAQRKAEAADQAERPAAVSSGAPAAVRPGMAQEAVAPPAPAAAPAVPDAPKPEAAALAKGQKAGTAYFDWTETELQQAFARLEQGGKVKDVAETFGKSWTALRAKWAAHRRMVQSRSTALVPVGGAPKTPVEKVSAAVRDLEAQNACTVCGRYFTPTLENLDLCARCSHDA